MDGKAKKEYMLTTIIVNICFGELVLCSITNSDIFIYLYIITATIFLISCSLRISLMVLISLTHFQQVVTLPINWSASFHIVLIMVFVFKTLMSAKLPVKNLILYIILAAYVLPGARIYKVQDMAGIVCLFILLVAVSLYKRDDWHKYIFFYIYGHILAIILSFFAWRSSRMINSLKRDYIIFNGISFTRFCGLDYDCNFFALNSLMILAILLTLHANDRRNKKYIILFIVYSVLGFITISKMFMLVYAGMMFLYFIYNFKKRNKRIILAIILIPLLCLVIDFGTKHMLTTYIISRFAGTKSLSGFTTGRTTIWVTYIKDFFSDLRKTVFGAGMANKNVGIMAPHNGYIEIIYEYGVIGCIIFITYIFSLYRLLVLKNGVIKIECRGFLLCITAVSNMSLGIFRHYFSVFIIFLIFILLLGFHENTMIIKER